MEFEGSKEEWKPILSLNKSRAVRNKGGLICTLIKPTYYDDQLERYNEDLAINKADQELIVLAGNLSQKYDLDHFEEVVEALKSMEYLSNPETMKGIADIALKSIERK